MENKKNKTFHCGEAINIPNNLPSADEIKADIIRAANKMTGMSGVTVGKTELKTDNVAQYNYDNHDSVSTICFEDSNNKGLNDISDVMSGKLEFKQDHHHDNAEEIDKLYFNLSDEQKKDIIRTDKVKTVFETDPIYERIKQQIEKGLKKYNTPVVPEHYSMLGWHNHVQEELTDAITYNEIMRIKLEDVVSALHVAYNNTKSDNNSIAAHHIKFALSILEDGKDS